MSDVAAEAGAGVGAKRSAAEAGLGEREGVDAGAAAAGAGPAAEEKEEAPAETGHKAEEKEMSAVRPCELKVFEGFGGAVPALKAADEWYGAQLRAYAASQKTGKEKAKEKLVRQALGLLREDLRPFVDAGDTSSPEFAAAHERAVADAGRMLTAAKQAAAEVKRAKWQAKKQKKKKGGGEDGAPAAPVVSGPAAPLSAQVLCERLVSILAAEGPKTTADLSEAFSRCWGGLGFRQAAGQQLNHFLNDPEKNARRVLKAGNKDELWRVSAAAAAQAQAAAAAAAEHEMAD